MNVYNEYLKNRGEGAEEPSSLNGTENVDPNGENATEEKA